MIKSQEFSKEWTKKEIIVFKAVFTYFCFYIFLMFFSSFFETPFRWFGSLLGFTYEYSVSGNGSGDNTYAFVTFYTTIVLSILVSTIWILTDCNKKSYNKLFYWFIVVLRIFLICAMLLYGFVKIFKVQFPDPSLSKLMQPLGDFSPMGLAWTYMGHSKMFNVFVGAMEVLGGLLLIPRRTQTIGSFIVTGVMTHVLIMNLCFDIPVKLFSAHLVLMSLVIFLTDIKRFINVFIMNKSVGAYKYYQPINNKKYLKIIRILKIVGLSIIILGASIFMFQAERKLNNYKKPVFYGVWETEYFIKNKDTLLPLITDGKRWRYLIIQKKDKALVKYMNDKTESFYFSVDTISEKISFRSFEDKNNSILKYTSIKPNFMELKGKIDNDSLHITLKKKDEFLLKSRGFNWINESPFNR